jgi:hypothetical protein
MYSIGSATQNGKNRKKESTFLFENYTGIAGPVKRNDYLIFHEIGADACDFVHAEHSFEKSDGNEAVEVEAEVEDEPVDLISACDLNENFLLVFGGSASYPSLENQKLVLFFLN